MKSSRLRPAPQLTPFAHIQPRWTGSLVALTVVQVAPSSQVNETYRSHTPFHALLNGLPVVVLPRKATSARSLSPTTTSWKVLWTMAGLSVQLRSWMLYHVKPPSAETATIGW